MPLRALTRLQATKSSPPPSLLAPTGNSVGLHFALDRAIKKWGWGEHGHLGLGNTNDQTIPQTVSLIPDIQNKEASLNFYCGSGFTFAIRSLSVNPDNISRN
ncbi:hypothetical protein H0E87_025550 [Populus deltoides]|uniref:Uncharacterized protein n=1 Tax=Populus deltoides TaxID=3696 RepID=A0A8T2X1M5_POPDE|nr:hypothetical protein H0E87_025550 [Populus deltoides]